MFGELLVLYLGSVAITAAVTKVRNMQADRKLKKNRYQIKSDERELGEKALDTLKENWLALVPGVNLWAAWRLAKKNKYEVVEERRKKLDGDGRLVYPKRDVEPVPQRKPVTKKPAPVERRQQTPSPQRAQQKTQLQQLTERRDFLIAKDKELRAKHAALKAKNAPTKELNEIVAKLKEIKSEYQSVVNCINVLVAQEQGYQEENSQGRSR